MAAHILISTPFMPHKREAIQKQTNTKGTHSTHRGLYAYLIFVRDFSLSLVKQSRESIRISRGFENTKTQLEASQDVLVRREITTPASTSFFSHLIHWLAHQTCYMKPPAGSLGNTSAKLIAMSFQLVNHRGAGDPSPISRKKNGTLKNG